LRRRWQRLLKLLLARDIDHLDPFQCRASSLSAGDHAPPQILANTQWHGTQLRGSRLTLFVSLIRPAAGLQAAEPSVRVSESTLSELEKTKIEMKKWLELPSISEVVVIKNADGTTSEHDLRRCACVVERHRGKRLSSHSCDGTSVPCYSCIQRNS
jgi:hypothetical protein